MRWSVGAIKYALDRCSPLFQISTPIASSICPGCGSYHAEAVVGAVFGSAGPSSTRPCAHPGIDNTHARGGGAGWPSAAASAGEMEALTGRGVVEARGATATRTGSRPCAMTGRARTSR